MTHLRALIVLLFAILSVVGSGAAHAADDPPIKAPVDPYTAAQAALQKELDKKEPEGFDRLDKAFGTLVVGPLEAVMFFDVLFWDNDLPLGEGVGRFEVPKDVSAKRPYLQKVTVYDPEQGYGRQRVMPVPDARLSPLLAEPTTRRIGAFDVNLQVERTAEGLPTLMARLPVQPVNLAAIGVQPWDPNGPELPAVKVMIPELGFPVVVDRRTLMIEPASGRAPAGLVEVAVGGPVHDSGTNAEYVVEGGAAGSWRVMDPEISWSKAPLANPNQRSLPVVVLWLVMGAIFFTLRMMFINLRAFPHAVVVVLGRYDHPDDPGEISSFQALSSALSATVGLGNIAGVAVAISLGGPGAVFWLWVAGFLGMSSKFTECTLGQMYRVTKPDGSVSGGPMHYLDKGLAELGLGPLGKGLAIMFAVMCVGGSLGGGNMFQANQSFEAIAVVIPGLAPYPWLYGLMLMVVVGFVIIGGIKRIGAAAGVVVPLMCGIYVLGGLFVLAMNLDAIPGALADIVSQAFSPDAQYGGLIGVLVMGFQRASFSNEAGVGSASIAHSAATTPEPVREGIVALLEPFIDTLIVCSVTALVVVVTGVDVPKGSGIQATMVAFSTILPWFPYVLAFAAMLFAFSTMVSWSYYGERSAVWLFGDVARIPYRVLFLICVFVGSVIPLANVLGFSDLMILGMAFPNILGALLLSGKVKRALDAYMSKLAAGDFEIQT